MVFKAMAFGVSAVVLGLSSLSVAAAQGAFDGAIEHAQFRGALELKGQLFHVQGLALDEAHIWVTSVDNDNHRGYIHVFERTSGKLLRRLEVTDGVRYHPGGISLAGGSLWVPVAEMKANSSAVLLEIDTASLQVRRRIHIADHIGCVAVSGTRLVAGNWDSRLFYDLDLARGGQYRTFRNPSATHYQDIKFVGDQLVASGNLDWLSGTIDWIDWPSHRVVRSLKAGAVGPVRPFGRGGPWTGEGMAIAGRELYFIPEDGPSRVFHFELDGPVQEVGYETRSS